MTAIADNKLTLNPDIKCQFGKREISFWEMIYSADDGIRPDPSKVEVLEFLTPPCNKAEVISFLSMMQSNAEFIPNIAHKADTLRQLTKKNAHFNWTKENQTCFEELKSAFKKETLLRYFDIGKPIYHGCSHQWYWSDNITRQFNWNRNTNHMTLSQTKPNRTRTLAYAVLLKFYPKLHQS